jgi:formylglycine-generating enzyme required for sulfatase activity/serine/threonine protein kinase
VAAAPEGHAGRHVRCKRCNAKFPLPHGVPTLPVAAGAIGRAPVLPESPTVIERYEVRELLGSGSFGSVYRAFDPWLGREVALKVLRTEMTASPQAVERFLREAKAAAKLDHPHIVAVFDAGRAGDVYYIASAFIKGGTLASAIPESGMEPRRAAELAAQLASALGYAHRQGVVHRDVKPANILLDEQGSLRLMDFGLAGWTQEECTRLTKAGAIMGTPAYMAPEQASGDTAQVGPASDLYSAGVVLYELLTGCRPFEECHPAALMYLIVHEAAAPPSARRPGLDANLEAICLKAMAKKPADRFADGEAMAAALRAWTPTAIRMAEPLATKAPAGLPAWMGEWDKETVDHRSGRPDKKPQSNLPKGGNQGRLSTVMASRFGPNWKLWACASLAILLAVVGAATVVYLFPPRAGAGAAIKTIKAPTREELQDEIVNSFDMRLKLIKPGTFLMGSPKDEEGRYDNEGPRQHEAEITQAFYMGVYPVTKGQFAAFAKAAPYTTEAETDGKGFGYNASTKKLESGKYSWRDPGFAQADDHPVVEVTWNDAKAFCEWLSKKEGKTYELPTEAEWEYACRAGTTTRFWCGDMDASLKGNANIADASLKEKYPFGRWAVAWNDDYPFTSPVGNFKANRWGLYDMHGNVWQWCADGYGPYQEGYIKDPKGKDSGNSRVLRGGSWYNLPCNCRSADRLIIDPANRGDGSGFRVALRPPARTP